METLYSQSDKMVNKNLNYGIIKIHVYQLRLLGLWPASTGLFKSNKLAFVLSYLYTCTIIIISGTLITVTVYGVRHGSQTSASTLPALLLSCQHICLIIISSHLTRNKIQNSIRMLQKFSSFKNPDKKIILILVLITILSPIPNLYIGIEGTYHYLSEMISLIWEDYIKPNQLVQNIAFYKSYIIFTLFTDGIWIFQAMLTPSIIILAICIILGKEFDKNVNSFDNHIGGNKLCNDIEKYLNLQKEFAYLVEAANKLNESFYFYIIFAFIDTVIITFTLLYYYSIGCMALRHSFAVIFNLQSIISILCISGQIIETKVQIFIFITQLVQIKAINEN